MTKKILSQILAYCEADIFQVLHYFTLTAAFSGGYLYFIFTDIKGKTLIASVVSSKSPRK